MRVTVTAADRSGNTATATASATVAQPSSLPTFGLTATNVDHLTAAFESGARTMRNDACYLGQYEVEGSLPEIGSTWRADNWRDIKAAGMEPLIQIHLSGCAAWAGIDGLYHNGQQDKQAVRPEVVADFAAHVVRELPEHTYFKLGNEMDRDGSAAWMDAYAAMMIAGYDAMKAERPDIVVAVEGGIGQNEVQACLDRGVYDHADIIDHHVYGGGPLYNSGDGRYLPRKLQMMHDAGYHQPVIASEFGVGPGGVGTEGLTKQEVADLLTERATRLLDIGFSTFYYFPFTAGVRNDALWNEAYMVEADGTRNPAFYSYQNLSA